MLVKFSLEPVALSEITDNSVFDNMYRNLWIPYGILVDSDISIKSVNVNFADELESAFKSYLSNGWPIWVNAGSINWSSILNSGDLSEFHKRFQLLFVNENRAANTFAIPQEDGTYSTYCGNVEVMRLRHSTLSEELAKAVQLSNENIEIGQLVDGLWRDRFQFLARYIEQVTIVDGYAFQNLRDGHKELFNLLEFLQCDTENGCNVTIYTAMRGMTIPTLNAVREELDNHINDEIDKNRIKQIVVYVSYDNVFNRRAHDRYIRFGGYTCTIGRGIEIFRDSTLRDETDFSLKSPRHLEERQNIESALRKGKLNASILGIPWRWP